MDDWDVGDVVLPGGRRLRVRSTRTRPPRGSPLVLLHGLLDDSEGWTHVARDTPRPCFAIDLPGFGGSSLPQCPRISAYAEDVVAGLDSLSVEGCTLVGHSLGGAVAAAVAERSDRVDSLIGVGGIASGSDAYTKIRAGASLIQLYTGLVFEGPRLVGRIKRELAELLRRDRHTSIADAVGTAHLSRPAHPRAENSRHF